MCGKWNWADAWEIAVVRSESVRNIIRERRMLEHLNHPFLCNLRYSFQDIEYLYVFRHHLSPYRNSVDPNDWVEF